jgi:hypothetical protein
MFGKSDFRLRAGARNGRPSLGWQAQLGLRIELLRRMIVRFRTSQGVHGAILSTENRRYYDGVHRGVTPPSLKPLNPCVLPAERFDESGCARGGGKSFGSKPANPIRSIIPSIPMAGAKRRPGLAELRQVPILFIGIYRESASTFRQPKTLAISPHFCVHSFMAATKTPKPKLLFKPGINSRFLDLAPLTPGVRRREHLCLGGYDY